MLKVLDKILTRAIDWLYLKRTKVRLALLARESEKAPPYDGPQPETIDRALAEYKLTREDLAVRMGGNRNVEANA